MLSEPANGEILKQARFKIKSALEETNRNSEKAILEVLDLIIIFMQEDHPKTQTMWRTYKPAIWAAGIIAATFLTLAVSGRVEIIVK